MPTELITRVETKSSAIQINHTTPVLLMGSCFSDAMGEFMRGSGLKVFSNPFGTLYNPLSIASCVERCGDATPLTTDDIVFNNGLWHSWYHHGSFSQRDRLATLADCTASFHHTAGWLQHPSVIVFTFGTAYIFRHNGRVVANCHKLPAKLFERTRLNIDDIVDVWKPLLKHLTAIGHRIIMTVSPIRHLADGAHGNQLSKATLLLAVEKLCAEGLAEYFPAYETLLDELRDYRFYADDMCHPSKLAENIVWQRFQQTYMSPDTINLSLKYQNLNRLKQHKPMHPDSAEYHAYLKKIKQLENELSHYTST